jgi:hypothetical protein
MCVVSFARSCHRRLIPSLSLLPGTGRTALRRWTCSVSEAPASRDATLSLPPLKLTRRVGVNRSPANCSHGLQGRLRDGRLPCGPPGGSFRGRRCCPDGGLLREEGEGGRVRWREGREERWRRRRWKAGGAVHACSINVSSREGEARACASCACATRGGLGGERERGPERDKNAGAVLS